MERIKKPTYRRGTNEDVFQQLRLEAGEIVERLEPKRRGEIVFKAFLFPGLYVFAWTAALIWGQNPWIYFACYFSLGLLLVFIFLNIIHDAVHGTIFKSKMLNNWYVHLFDLMGANSFIWRLRHVRFHHNYPNVNGWDTDIEQSDMARVFPTGGFSKMHKYQHIYLPLIYPLFLFNWLVVRDFKDFFVKKKTVRKLIDIPAIEYVKLFFFKALFFFYMIFVPKMVLGIGWGQAIGGFLLMVFTASIFALFVLLPPHANTENEFPLPDDKNRLPGNWFMHMLQTTNDVKEDNWFTRFFMGSFNYHVVHHLFPNINHVYYPELTKLLEDYSKRYNLPYRKFPILTSLKNHYKLIKQNRMPVTEIFEETM
ncbi:MAG: fatty acid desaturase [Chitinophagaceae bacterium]|nr:fatty acid desaturase [Chitinophagaceae bacterium]